jgi:protein-tyrosine phosphatase
MKSIRNIMFMCYGNTCRSPMAESIARDISTDNIFVTSCGLNVIDDKLNDKAVRVINDKLKIDISNRKPKSIHNVDLKIIDTIYSLDKEVSRYLNESSTFSGNIIELLVEDPFGRDISKYYDTYNELLLKLQSIANEKGSI